MSWILPCPKCGREREFGHYASFWVARKQASVCHSCAGYGKKSGVRLTAEQVAELLRLHSEGRTNRSIAKKLNVHHGTVASILKKHGLECNGTKRRKLEKIGNGLARCSKCRAAKPETEFTVNRRGKKYEYPLSYCFGCRHRQQTDNLNSDIDLYLGDRWRRVQVRARKTSTPFTITREVLYDLYEMQKGNCFYTDAPMRCRVGEGTSWDSLSIDKVEPDKGYEHGNVVLCTRRANTIKCDMTLDEMKKWMPDWYKRVRKFQSEEK